MTRETRHIINRVLFYAVLALVSIYLLFPFYWAINSSFKTENQLQMTPATFVPRDPATDEVSFSLRNYQGVFQNEDFGRGLINSTIVAVSTTVLSLAIGSFAAFALGKLRFRGKTPSLYLILSYMLFTLPFTTWVMTSFFRGLPTELMQSAQVDGATPFQTFYKILLPLTMPALVTTGLLAFINAWNEYLFALTFTTIESSARTVPVVMALFTGQISRQEPFGEIMAAAILITIPLLILVLIFQQKIVEGLTAGAVKG